MHEELPLFVHWERVLSDLLDRTQRFPKAWRFTLTRRIEELGIDILELVVDACYRSGPATRAALVDADRRLTRLRVLLRLAHGRRLLDHGGYEHVSRGLAEAGRMLGGWRKQQSAH